MREQYKIIYMDVIISPAPEAGGCMTIIEC